MPLGQDLKRVCESQGPRAVTETFASALSQGKIDPYKIHLPELAHAFLGDVGVNARRKLLAVRHGHAHVLESTEAQDASTFSNITGQLLVTIIKEKYEAPEFVASKLVKTYPNPGGNLKEHKIPYLSDVLDKGEKLQQLEPYPHTQFKESWVTMPAPTKFGRICAISWEMLYSDLTSQAQDSAASIGRAIAYQKEERILRTVLGLSTREAAYKWNDNSLLTYVTTANAGAYVNRLAANTILNWENVNSVEQLFWKMTDPITGRRIFARPSGVLCTPQKRYALKRILNATETRSGDVTTGTGDQVLAANPLDTNYPIHTSAIMQALIAAETMENTVALSAGEQKELVIFADFAKAFGYREVYPLYTEPAPPLNPMEFNQDIVLAVKASEYGVPFTYDPRWAVQSTSEAS